MASHFFFLQDDTKIADGDLVKLECGVHIDGYLALAAHTFVVSSEPITGRKADVVAATYVAADCILRLLRPGNKVDCWEYCVAVIVCFTL